MEECRYRVLAASDPAEAVRLCEGHGETIHLLLTDVVMPRMNGRQLAAAVAEQRPETRVLYMSGYTDDAVLRRGLLDPELPFLKIDRSFVHASTDDDDDAAVVAAIVLLARTLGLQAVAEGVETEGQLGLLRSLGCGRAQGYLFGRPLPADEVRRQLPAKE